MSEYIDKEFVCIGCQSPFFWTAGEQKFLQKLLEAGKLDRENEETGKVIPGRITPPKRCPDCRAANKQKKEEMGLSTRY